MLITPHSPTTFTGLVPERMKLRLKCIKRWTLKNTSDTVKVPMTYPPPPNGLGLRLLKIKSHIMARQNCFVAKLFTPYRPQNSNLTIGSYRIDRGKRSRALSAWRPCRELQPATGEGLRSIRSWKLAAVETTEQQREVGAVG